MTSRKRPEPSWASAWAELTGYVQQAVDGGGTIRPVDLLDYMTELHRRALAPVAAWLQEIGLEKKNTDASIDQTSSGQTSDTSPTRQGDTS